MGQVVVLFTNLSGLPANAATRFDTGLRNAVADINLPGTWEIRVKDSHPDFQTEAFILTVTPSTLTFSVKGDAGVISNWTSLNATQLRAQAKTAVQTALGKAGVLDRPVRLK